MTEHPDEETYRLYAEGLVGHNDMRRGYAAELLEDQFLDEPLQIHFAANTKVVFDDEGEGAFVTCSIWVPNPNRRSGWDEDDGD